MGQGIRIRLSPGAERMIDRLGTPSFLLNALAKAMDKENQLTITHISTKRMRGNDGKPFPPGDHILGIRSKRLYKSLWNAPTTVSGTSLSSAIGTNVEYAGVHEDGFSGEVTVAPHKRKKFSTQIFDAGYSRLGKRKTVRKKVRGADISVGSHKRLLKIPARAPITTGVEERMEAVSDALSTAVIETVSKNL